MPWGAARLVDQTGLAPAASFVWHRLSRYETELLEWFKLLPLQGRHLLRGMCRYPLRAAPRSRELRQGYRITASANVRPSFYPHRYTLVVGTMSAPATTRRRGRRHARDWEYVTEEVTFRDASEALVFVAGHEAFHFLRHTRQIDGRNTEPGANRSGLAWLSDWRAAVVASCSASAVARRRDRVHDFRQLLLPLS